MDKAQLETPELLVDLDKLDANIQRVANIAKGSEVALRPHVKTHKTPAIAHKQLDAGAQGITVAKLGEAEVMASAGIRDIFIAYEIIGERKIERLINLTRHARVSVGVDSPEGALALSKAFYETKQGLEVRIEIDTGLGRCGVPPFEPALDLARDIVKLPGLNLKGIFTHEGHTIQAGNLKRVNDLTKEIGRLVVGTADLFRRSGIHLEAVSVGSTPAVMAGEIAEGITEIRPGTYVFFDASGIQMGFIQEADCAATVMATVISRPAPDRVILDSGSKALTVSRSHGGQDEVFIGYGIIKGIQGAVIDTLNEEHAYVRLTDPNAALNIGDQVEIIPYHICPVINLYDQMVGIRAEQVEVVWPILARGKCK